jgi:hypothetical protein
VRLVTRESNPEPYKYEGVLNVCYAANCESPDGGALLRGKRATRVVTERAAVAATQQKNSGHAEFVRGFPPQANA